MSNSIKKSKGAWLHRFGIHSLTVILGLLIFWLLGFLVEDIQSIEGPEYVKIEKKYLKQELLDKKEKLGKQITDLSRQIDNQTEKQHIIGDSSKNLQQTINQILELQKTGIQKNITFSNSDQATFTNSMNLFFENQKKYQELSQLVSDLIIQKQQLVRQKEQIEQNIEEQRKPAEAEYKKIMDLHRLRLAFLQLAILIPLLIVASFIIIKKKNSIYFPIFIAFGLATLIKVALVMHEYFPSKHFKYVLIILLLMVVARLLVYFIKITEFPKIQWLLKQYREAYERFLCPICEYPIRIGPRRFLFWTRRTVNKIIVPTERDIKEEPYTCPTCGTSLFEECVTCHKIRHSMLPHCEHCGAEKEIKS